MKILKDWHTLPAHLDQWFMHVMRGGRCFVVYLRYDKHMKKWTASIVECNDDGHWDMHQYPFEWYALTLGTFVQYDKVDWVKIIATHYAWKFTNEVIHEGRITTEQ